MEKVELATSDDANESRMYERGIVVWHSSEEDGGPDVGISVGLGNGQMLYVGELPNPENYGMKVYGQGDDETFLVAEISEPHDLHRFLDLLASLLPAPAPSEGMREALERIRDRHFTDEAGDREWVEWAKDEARAALSKEQAQ